MLVNAVTAEVALIHQQKLQRWRKYSSHLAFPVPGTWSCTSQLEHPGRQGRHHRGCWAAWAEPHSPGGSPVESHWRDEEDPAPNLNTRHRGESQAERSDNPQWAIQKHATRGQWEALSLPKIQRLLISKGISECHMNECSHLWLYFFKNSRFRSIHLNPGKNSPTMKVTLCRGVRWRHWAMCIQDYQQGR